MPAARSVTLSRADLINLKRVHVTNPGAWAVQAGTDFWLYGGANGLGTSSGQFLITDGGWTATSLLFTDGSLADFISKADMGTYPLIGTDAAADLLSSPSIFGDYAHAHQAAVILGQNSLPRYLVMDALANFTVSSANEVTSQLGFIKAGGSPVTAANALATFTAGAANFCTQSNAVVQVGATVLDNLPHWFRIVIDQAGGPVIKSFIDGVLQSTLVFAAAQQDVWPVKFGFGDGTTNRWQVNQVHIFYDYSFPFDYQVF